MNRLVFSIALVILGIFESQGQAEKLVKVSGLVQDATTQAPIELATVMLKTTSNQQLITGTYTDAEGRFVLNAADTMIADLTITILGYDKLEMKGLKVSELDKELKLQMKPNDQKLAEVVVEGSNEAGFVEMKIDKKVYKIDQMQVLEGSTTSEALQIIPSVEVDIDGNISLRGSENLVVLIDGKPSGLSGDDLAAYLESMPAAMLENVELITNPSAKYDPDGMAGIINLVSKTNKFQGFNGNVSLNAGTSGFYSGSAMLSVKKGKWNVMANLSYNYRNGFAEGLTERITYGLESDEYLYQTTLGDHIRQMGMASLNTTYTINDNNKLSFSGMLSLRQMSRQDLNYYEFSDADQNMLSVSDRTTDGGGRMMPNRFSLDYTKTFKKEDQKLSLGAGWATFDGDFYSLFEENNYSDDLVRDEIASLRQRQNTIPDNQTLTLQLDYAHPIGKNALLETGLKSINKSGGSDFVSEIFDFETGAWVNENNLTNDFLLDEGIHSAYATFKQQLGKFGYQLGLRAEQAFTDAQLLSNNESFYNEYFSLFPSLNLSYWLPKKQQLKASYSRRLNRPHGRMLNPFTDFSDPQNIRKGNPFLLPEYINSYEVEYQKFWHKQSITAAVYYKDINGMITRIKEVSDGVSVVSYENLGSGVNKGVEFSWSAKPASWWNFTLSGNAFQTTITGTEGELNAEGFAYRNKLLTTFTLPKEYSIQVQANYSSPKIVAQGTISAMYFGDLSVKKRVLNKKGNVSLKLSDVFNTREFDFVTSDINFYQESYRKRQSQILWLGFSYNFGQFSERRNRGGGGDDSDDQVEID